MAGISKKNQGFTLIEMAIVLVIIGIIISAVSIGQNLQRSAEIQKMKQKFIDQWAIAYNQYYNRTGVVVGDSQQEPRYMVAGADHEFAVASGGGSDGPGVPNAANSGISLLEPLPKICQGQGYDNFDSEGYGLSTQNLHELMDRAGVRMPPARTEGREDRYVYLDSNGNPQEVQVCFQWNPASSIHGSGNVMVIRGLTPEIAREFDRMVDGKADATEGVFRQYNETLSADGNITSGQAGEEWLGNNTFSMADAPVTADTDGENLDEDQILLVTAIYKMDQ